MIKITLILLSFLPLTLYSPYLIQAWSSSRLDHWDWIFYLLSLAAAFWSVHKEKFGKCDFYALFLLCPMLLLTAGGSFHHINALSIASAAGVIFAAIWLLGSWQLAYKVLPAAIILLLGTPSSSYQLSLLMMCPVYMAWLVKFLLAVICMIWIWCNKRFELQLAKGTLFFSASALLTAFVLLHTRELYFEGRDFIPEFMPHTGEFWGRTILPDADTKRFFATSTVRQYRYSKADIDISVLAVQCGKNIHEIHPASHCLRTSQWTVNSEKIVYLQNNFAVTEIDAEKGTNRCLVWVWFSSGEFSTPSFLGFRKHFQNDGNYWTFQISIPVYESAEKSRNELHKFIKTLKRKEQ